MKQVKFEAMYVELCQAFNLFPPSGEGMEACFRACGHLHEYQIRAAVDVLMQSGRVPGKGESLATLIRKSHLHLMQLASDAAGPDGPLQGQAARQAREERELSPEEEERSKLWSRAVVCKVRRDYAGEVACYDKLLEFGANPQDVGPYKQAAQRMQGVGA